MNYISHSVCNDQFDIVCQETSLSANKKGVVSLILVCNRRLWACKGPNCHVKNDISAGENELALTDGPHDRTRELTRGSVTF